MYYGQGPQYPYQPPAPMGLQCPKCGFVGQPFVTQRVSVVGWIVFSILLLCCLPLFWIGLLMKDTVAICPRCFQRP